MLWLRMEGLGLRIMREVKSIFSVLLFFFKSLPCIELLSLCGSLTKFIVV